MIQRRRTIGVALGSGGARGWAHIGALRALEEAGIVPDVVCGASIGALVGAAYAGGALEVLEEWARGLTWGQVLRYFDLTTSGGLIRAARVFQVLEKRFPDRPIEELGMRYAAVATDLSTGREEILRSGSLFQAVRASAAMPGLVSPFRYGDTWLVDGGLVNAIPVSVCRLLGAELVVAVDLQTTLLHPARPMELRAAAGRREVGGDEGGEGRDRGEGAAGSVGAPGVSLGVPVGEPVEMAAGLGVTEAEAAVEATAVGGAAEATTEAGAGAGSAVIGGPGSEGESSGFWRHLRSRAAELRRMLQERGAEHEAESTPSIQEVLTKSMDIVQYRIARSRLAGDPPELLIAPKLPGIGTLDFHKAEEAIAAGRRAAERSLASLGWGGE